MHTREKAKKLTDNNTIADKAQEGILVRCQILPVKIRIFFFWIVLFYLFLIIYMYLLHFTNRKNRQEEEQRIKRPLIRDDSDTK